MATTDIKIERWNNPTWAPGSDTTGAPTTHTIGTLIEPADHSWGLWLDHNGTPTMFAHRTPQDGAIQGEPQQLN